MTAPSNVNTSGLEVVAWRRRSQDNHPWSLFDSPEDRDFYTSGDREARYRVEPLVTAASAQARIAELEADLSKVVAQRDSHWDEYLAERQSRMEHGVREAGYLDVIPKLTHRATAAEARADRLAKDTKGLLVEIASFGRAFMAAQESLEATSTPDAYDDAILAASVRYQSMVKTASALYRAALQQEG